MEIGSLAVLTCFENLYIAKDVDRSINQIKSRDEFMFT